MNWKSFFTGFSSGIVGGLVAYHYLSKTVSPSSEKILEKVKQALREKGPIIGSWIHMEAVPYEANQLKYHVFKGGITQNRDGETKQLEFIADAQTGAILSISPS